MDMPSLIEILMLSAAALILIISRTDGIKATQGSVFPAGMQAVIAISVSHGWGIPSLMVI